MGYDSRLYIIRKTSIPSFGDDNFQYAETVVIYEMHVFPPFQKLFGKSCPATKYAPFAPGDGNHAVTIDSYGNTLKERSLTEVIDCLNDYIKRQQNRELYARVKPLLALLQEFEKIHDDDIESYYQLAVLHYGH